MRYLPQRRDLTREFATVANLDSPIGLSGLSQPKFAKGEVTAQIE
jgi:hypothetical protein